MNCKNTKDLLCLYHHGDLEKHQMEKIALHLQECNTCAVKYEHVKEVLTSVNEVKIQKEDSFFYTRVKAKMETQSTQKGFAVRKAILSVGYAALLIFGIFFGMKLGNSFANYSTKAEMEISESYFEDYATTLFASSNENTMVYYLMDED